MKGVDTRGNEADRGCLLLLQPDNMARKGGATAEPRLKLHVTRGPRKLPKVDPQLAQVRDEHVQRKVLDGVDGVAAAGGDQDAVEEQQIVRTLSQNGYGHAHTHTHTHTHTPAARATPTHASTPIRFGALARMQINDAPLSSMRPCGLMDKALVFGTKDCRFESCQGQLICP